MQIFKLEDMSSLPSFNVTPIVDFLFLMLSLFATLAMSRASLCDSELALVKTEQTTTTFLDKKYINISIDAEGKYTWVTDVTNHPMEDIASIKKELIHQYEVGALPKDKSQTTILLHVDKSTPWEAVAKMIFCVKEIGFNVHPVYEKR